MGLYLHVPFCIRKCNYCDFLSFGGIPEEGREAYFQSLLQEIRLNGQLYGNKYYVDSIFIGGGTPSLVSEGLIEELMAALRESFAVDENAEISMEANPKTLTGGKLETYLEAGINRLSMGVQTLDDSLLRDLGRAHSVADFLDNYRLARDCGFRNINVDLMFSIPNQTQRTWMKTLEQAVALEPEHISFYGLQLEEGTPFFTMLQEGRLQETEGETDRRMYHDAVELLASRGYRHYEISNAAKDGYQCRHNLKYWSMEDYLGLGLGAHSFLEGIRFSNTTDLEEYNDSRDQAPNPYVRWRHKNSRQETIAEYLFTGLRKIQGIDAADFRERFGQTVEEVYAEGWERIQRYFDEGFLIRSGDRIRFSEKGIDISNTILAEFI